MRLVRQIKVQFAGSYFSPESNAASRATGGAFEILRCVAHRVLPGCRPVDNAEDRVEESIHVGIIDDRSGECQNRFPLRMPRKDGRTVLKEIKSDPDLRQIPVVVLTTSKADEDVYKSYDLGVNSYIVKPVTFEALVDILQTLEKYWFEIVELPPVKG